MINEFTMSNRFNLDKLNSIESSVDLTKVPQISKKRLITFINEFIITTVSFLNNFAQSCESRLYQFDVKMQKLEAELCILESKLNSVPGLEVEIEPVPVSTANIDATNISPEVVSQPQVVDENKTASDVPDSAIENDTEQSEAAVPASRNPELAKYFRMLQLGVPEPAVKLKMQCEGYDPNLLDSKG